MRYIIKFLSGIDKYLKVNTSAWRPFDSDLTTDLFEARTFKTASGAINAATRIGANWLKGQGLVVDYIIFEVDMKIIRRMT